MSDINDVHVACFDGDGTGHWRRFKVTSESDREPCQIQDRDAETSPMRSSRWAWELGVVKLIQKSFVAGDGSGDLH